VSALHVGPHRPPRLHLGPTWGAAPPRVLGGTAPPCQQGGTRSGTATTRRWGRTATKQRCEVQSHILTKQIKKIQGQSMNQLLV